MTSGRDDALLAARLCVIDPMLGGMVVRAGEPLGDDLLEALREASPTSAPIRRLPTHIDDDRLLGGVDLTATLAQGRTIVRVGLLGEADGGAVIVPMAERMSDALAGRLVAALDTGEVVVERDGVTLRADARFVVVAFDDGVEADERPPAALVERLAFRLDLSDRGQPLASSSRPAGSVLPDAEVMRMFVTIAAALGVDSIRAPLLALRAARAAARLAGRDAIDEADVMLAVRLVLAPRATRIPAAPETEAAEPPSPSDPDGGEEERGDLAPTEDVVLAAALSALPPDVLAGIAAGRSRQPTRANGAGERRRGARGRPLAPRAGTPRGGRRLSLIDTLRAAAPWQRLRGREAGDRIAVRRDDLRIRRFEARSEGLTIFAVDASGSSALARLAEAKGAVELLLAEAYVKRAQVALIAFRKSTAELLLPPTRSLTRARRALADLPGGGGTPLAAGLEAARALAESARAKGQTPFVVVLTDGRANVAADGSSARTVAAAEAETAAKAIGAARIAAAFVDISARPRPEGAALAAAMGARYLPLPRADAQAMHAAVRAVQPR